MELEQKMEWMIPGCAAQKKKPKKTKKEKPPNMQGTTRGVMFPHVVAEVRQLQSCVCPSVSFHGTGGADSRRWQENKV